MFSLANHLKYFTEAGAESRTSGMCGKLNKSAVLESQVRLQRETWKVESGAAGRESRSPREK